MNGRHSPNARAVRRSLTALVVVVLIAALVTALYQDPIAQWGSTAAERHGAVVGDDLVADADTSWTRSITIDAPPEKVWPWLVQIGEGRAGFYNYDWGEQIFADPIHNAITIHPEWQTLQTGEVIHPKPGADWTVVVVDPNRALVLENPLVTPTDWTWATELRPLDGDRTRVVTRIRNRKGSFFSYSLDVPDLILFPRLLTGLKQRAEGTLPGMPGTHTGRPFPLARLPVHSWAAALWLVSLGAAAAAFARPLGLGRWGRRRPHPWITVWSAFVVGAGYVIMSDTPPLHFVTHVWALGVVSGVVAGGLLVRVSRAAALDPDDRSARWFPRAATAFVETGVTVVLPVTAVWQAATAQAWTTSMWERVVVSGAAAAVATLIAWVAWRRAGSLDRGRTWVPPLVLALAYASTGSALGAFVGAVIYETAREQGAGRRAVAREPQRAQHDEQPPRSLVGAAH